MADDREVFSENAVRQRKKCVDGVAGGTAIPVGEVERKIGRVGVRVVVGIAGLDHAGEELEVDPCGVALEAQELVERFGAFGIVAQAFESSDLGGGRLDVVPLEHGSLVPDLAGDEVSSDAEAKGGIVGQAELLAAKRDVADAESLGDSVKPSSLGEVADRGLVLAEGLDRLGGELDAPEEVDLAGFSDADFLDDLVLLLDLQDVARLADVKALGVEIERAQVVARGDEPARLGAVGFLRRLIFLDEERFVREADADEGTPGALGTVDERSRDATGSGRGAGFDDRREGLLDQGLVDRHADPLFRLDVIEHSFVAGVPVVA